MQSRSEWKNGPNGERAEVGIIVHEGKEYASGGAFVTPTHAVGYLSSDMLSMMTWDGQRLGSARVVSSWPMPRSWMSSRQYQVEATIDGRTYTGRTMGAGMLWRGKAKKDGAR